MDEMAAHAATLAPDPLLNWFTGGIRWPHRPGRDDLITLQTGQAAGMVRHRTVAALMQEFAHEPLEVIARLGTRRSVECRQRSPFWIAAVQASGSR
jgi:hypothetical protein